MTTTTTIPKLSDRIFGTRPAHTHRSSVSGAAWQCNSPYCDEMEIPHPEEGGFEPIVQGREPWKGKS